MRCSYKEIMNNPLKNQLAQKILDYGFIDEIKIDKNENMFIESTINVFGKKHHVRIECIQDEY